MCEYACVCLCEYVCVYACGANVLRGMCVYIRVNISMCACAISVRVHVCN